MTDDAKIRTLGNFTWTIAELLRGDYKQFEYGKVILPFVVLRRLDCILEASKGDVLAAAGSLPDGIDDPTRDMLLFDAAGGLKVYNTSPLTFAKIKGQSPAQVHENLVSYVTAFSPSIRDVFLDKFKLMEQLKRLAEAELLWLVFERCTQIDLHPDNLSNLEMGYLFEDLIRRFSEISNETAGEHFTPREIVKLIVEMILANDHEALTGSGVIRTIYDPACGTGGMLALTEAELKAINPRMRVELYGQELNGESYAICKSDMLLSGHDPDQIAFGNTLSQDAHSGRRFHYMVSNPPYGVDWKKYADVIRTEAESLGHDGRFGAGLPRQSDGQLLFLQHMIAKMRDDEVGSQIGIVMNGSPLFTGGAGSGESEIRRWLLENDWVEAIVGLPNDIFYNTGIQTYVWLITNRKEEKRRGKVQLIDASSHHFWTPLRKSLGSKRREIGEAARDEIVKIYSDMLNGETGFSEYSKIVDVTDFGYRELKIERPLRLAFQFTADRLEKLSWSKQVLRLDEAVRDNLLAQLSTLPRDRFVSRPAFEKCIVEVLRQGDLKLSAPLMKLIVNSMSERDQAADICRDRKGRPEYDATLRDFELVPLKDDWREHFAREVVPHCPEAWVDENHTDPQSGDVGRIGYEIPFNRFFAKPERLRSLTDLEADAQRQALELSALIQGLGKEQSPEIQALARAKVKPSGIEWIDAIPEHWSVVPIRRSARLESGHTPSRQVPEYWIEEECTIDWFTLADVGTLRDGSVTYIEKTVNRISPLGMANSAARLLPSGTVILSRTASVGYSGILATPMAVSQDFAAWVCDERLLPEYLLLCLRCMKGEFRRLMMGSTHQTIYMPDISRLTIPLPPLEEQQAIAHAVLSRKGDQDALVSAASRTAEILRERQQAFMFEAVTGKILVSPTSVAERAA